MTERERSRRSLLRSGAATTALLGGLAGCVESLPGPVGGDGSGDVPDYARWVPSESSLGVGSDGTIGVSYLDVGGLLDNEGNLAEGALDGLESGMGEVVPLPSAESVDSVVGILATGASLVYVAEGSFSSGDVEVAPPLGGDVDADGTYEGYEVYPIGRVAVAAGDGRVVTVIPSGDEDPRPDLETVVDAERGAVERLAEADDDVARALGEVGTPLYGIASDPDESNLQAPNPSALEAFGQSTTLDGPDAELQRQLVYENRGAVDADAVGSAAGEWDGFGDAADRSVSTSGRVATVSATVPAAEFTVSQFNLVYGDEDAGGSG